MYQQQYVQASPYPAYNQEMIQVNLGNSGLDLLKRLPSVYVKQKPDLLEGLGFCEQRNTYFVYPSDDQGNKPDFKTAAPIFKCKEKSSCFQRNCLPGSCRAFEMIVKQYNQREDTHKVIYFARDYKLTFCCLGRPTLEIYTEDGTKLGSIYFPFMFCDKGVEIHDEKGLLVYKVMGSCCQWPFLVNMPCEACQRARFDITDNMGQKVSEIWKESPGFCAALCTDSENFRIIFPQGSNGKEKALLLAATLFIDYNYFETSPADQQNQNY
ncbi:hypothetical protein pb186bvf_000569 [Paramecium bursaria]